MLTACAPDAPDPTGVVIVNARVIDGSGGPSRDVNVRVVGDRIATVGTLSRRQRIPLSMQMVWCWLLASSTPTVTTIAG